MSSIFYPSVLSIHLLSTIHHYLYIAYLNLLSNISISICVYIFSTFYLSFIYIYLNHHLYNCLPISLLSFCHLSTYLLFTMFIYMSIIYLCVIYIISLDIFLSYPASVCVCACYLSIYLSIYLTGF